MEAVRQIHANRESCPEEATVEAIHRAITGESSASALAKKPKKKAKKK